MYRETVASSRILRYAIPVGASFVTAETVFAYLNRMMAGAVAVTVLAIVALLLWLSMQFSELFVYADREGVFLAFGRIERQVMRAAIRSAKPFRITLWNAGGLGIRRGWRYEGWIARTGKGVLLELTDGKRFIFSSERPEATIRAMRLKV